MSGQTIRAAVSKCRRATHSGNHRTLTEPWQWCRTAFTPELASRHATHHHPVFPTRPFPALSSSAVAHMRSYSQRVHRAERARISFERSTAASLARARHRLASVVESRTLCAHRHRRLAARLRLTGSPVIRRSSAKRSHGREAGGGARTDRFPARCRAPAATDYGNRCINPGEGGAQVCGHVVRALIVMRVAGRIFGRQ
jgi:hypothetical protein